MWPLTRRRRTEGDSPRRDPAPTRWGYRYQRLMLTPMFRRGLRVGLPVALVAAIAGAWASNPDNRLAVEARYIQVRDQIQSRPEFAVRMMEVEGADTALEAEVRRVLPVDFPVSSFDLDLEDMRQTVAALNAVATANLRVRPGGVLKVELTQRQPVAVWRASDGLRLIDGAGAFVGPLSTRADRADLPLVAGDGARSRLEEALTLYETARPLADRMRGLVRMGERRWDVVLDREQRILLPSDDPVRALERVLALNEAQDMLARDIAVVDMRNAARPTIRLNEPAMAELRRITDVQSD